MFTAWLPVAEGDAGVRQIVGKLEALKEFYGAQPAIRRAAVTIARSGKNDDDAGNVDRLARFVKSALVYLKDPINAEFIQTPDVLLLEIARSGRAYGDCDDHVLLFASLAESIGVPTQVGGVKLDSERFNHVIAIAYVNGEPVEIDLCAKEGGQPAYPEKLFA